MPLVEFYFIKSVMLSSVDYTFFKIQWLKRIAK